MSASPPQGWVVDTGTWSTDIDQETSVVDVGDYSLKFKSTAVAAKLISEEFIPVYTGDYYTALFRVRYDGSAAVYTGIRWFDSSESVISTTSSGVTPSAANTWEYLGASYQAPANARFAKLIFGKNAATAQVVYFQQADLKPTGPFWDVRMSGDQSVNASTDTLVGYDTTGDGLSGVGFASNIITIRKPGVYSMGANAQMNALLTGEAFDLFIDGTAAFLSTSSARVVSYTSSNYRLNVSVTMPLNAGDTVGVYARHNGAAARTIDAVASSGKRASCFWGSYVGPF